MTNSETYMPSKAVQTRYSISDRTLDRWIAKPALAFPKPLVINKRRYWSIADIDAWDKKQNETSVTTDAKASL